MARLATAAVLAPVLWALIKRTPEWGFSLAALLLILVVASECFRLFETRGDRPFTWLGMLTVAATVWSFRAAPPEIATHLPLVALVALTLIAAMFTRNEPEEVVRTAVSTTFPVALIGLGLGYLVGLRGMPGEDGPDLVLLLFWCVIFGDTGAYYVGKNFGRRPLAPRWSPKKTWEGAAGGLAASVLAAVIAKLWFYQRLPWEHVVIVGLALAIVGILGDLAESALKRAAGVKDSSSLLPGHGGLLDRADSLLFAAPFLYYYYSSFLRVA
jgi:phosphatidate cytidylyltransferase